MSIARITNNAFELAPRPKKLNCYFGTFFWHTKISQVNPTICKIIHTIGAQVINSTSQYNLFGGSKDASCYI